MTKGLNKTHKISTNWHITCGARYFCIISNYFALHRGLIFLSCDLSQLLQLFNSRSAIKDFIPKAQFTMKCKENIGISEPGVQHANCCRVLALIPHTHLSQCPIQTIYKGLGKKKHPEQRFEFIFNFVNCTRPWHLKPEERMNCQTDTRIMTNFSKFKHNDPFGDDFIAYRRCFILL